MEGSVATERYAEALCCRTRRGTRLERTARLPDSGPDLLLALLHVRLPRVALPVRTGLALRCRTKIRARDAQIPLPDCRAFFNDVCRSLSELLQIWSQAAHIDSQ